MAFAIALPLMFLIISSSSSAVGASPAINVFTVDQYHKQILAGEGSSFEWVVFNNDTSPCIVRLGVTPSANVDVSEQFNVQYVTLEPGASSPVTLSISTHLSMPTSNVSFSVSFIITRMSDPNQSETIHEEANLIVVSSISERIGQNKIFGIWDNFLPSPLNGNEGAFLASVIGWLLIGLFFAYVVDPFVHLFTKKTETALDDILLKLVRMPIFAFIISYGVVNSLEILALDRDLITQIDFAYKVVVILLVVWVAYRIYHNVVIYYAKEYSKKTNTEIDDVLVPLMEKIGVVVIPLLGLIAIFNLFGYDVTALLAGVGFLGIVVGFAAQSTLANFFAGIQLLADRPFKVGDLLMLDNGDMCEVKHIGMRATELYNPDTNELVIIPNNDIANKKIINMMEPDRKLKLMVRVDVAYGSPVEKVMSILKDTALSHPNVLKEKLMEPVVRFADFGESSMTFKTFIWIDDLNNRYKVPSDFRQEIERRFRAEGIEIPFPQQVVHFIDETDQQKSELK
jgi:MscS family membrane protein